jgi:hypothetical protein
MAIDSLRKSDFAIFERNVQRRTINRGSPDTERAIRIQIDAAQLQVERFGAPSFLSVLVLSRLREIWSG